EIPEDKTVDLGNIINTYNDIVDDNNKFTSELENAKKNAQNALRLQEVFEFCDTIKYSEIMKKIDILQKEKNKASETLQSIQNKIDVKMAELQEKRRLLNDEEEGARQVNQYLKNYFGYNYLSLQAEKIDNESSKTRFKIYRNNKPAFNLSEGECSFIAFCYFIAKLNDIDTQNKKPIIWIDDPISSLDSNHVFFVYSLILSEIVKKCNWSQLFLSTHNLDFLKYLHRLNAKEHSPSKNKLVSVEKRYFVIQRKGELSTIQKMPKYLSEYATEYNYLFSQIYKCSQIETIDDSNHDLICNFGNIARRFLEIHLYFKYPDMSDCADKLRKYFKTDDIAAEMINRLCNESSHGSLEQAEKVDELPEAIYVAKKIIKKLQEDTEQYSSLLNSIS
ncbi:MAG: AAA family ATPase, partial [Treponema sp.]|nr:AAA family ATPase [Treponema sp.]